MEHFFDLLKITIPAALVLYGVYLTVRSFLNKEFEKHLAQAKINNSATAFPIRLQAYERMALFLERIAINNLIIRLNQKGMSSAHFQQFMLSEIREEFNHNLSQQIYMSDESWNHIKNAMEDVVVLINQSAEPLPKETDSMILAKGIFENATKRENDANQLALLFLKKEVRELF